MNDRVVAANRLAGAISDAVRRESVGNTSVLSILHAVRGVF